MITLPHITDVHDLHIWSIAGERNVLSAHVKVTEDCPLSQCDGLLDDIHCLVCERYHISHTTIQLEYAGCPNPDLYCMLPGATHRYTHAPDGMQGTVSAANKS